MPPHQQDEVQHGLEQLGQLLKVSHRLHAPDPRLQHGQVLRIVVGLIPGTHDLLAQLGEWRAVRVLRLVHESKHKAHGLALQLGLDGIEVGRLCAPELQLHVGGGVVALLH